MKSHELSYASNSSLSIDPSAVVLTDLVNLGWLLLGAEAAISHIDVGITACAITTVELTLAQVHVRLCQLRMHFRLGKQLIK